MEESTGFEESLGQLEQRIRKLEGGDIPLEDALKLFEQGVSLARECHEHLDAAEQRVASLTRNSGEISEEPLNEPES